MAGRMTVEDMMTHHDNSVAVRGCQRGRVTGETYAVYGNVTTREAGKAMYHLMQTTLNQRYD